MATIPLLLILSFLLLAVLASLRLPGLLRVVASPGVGARDRGDQLKRKLQLLGTIDRIGESIRRSQDVNEILQITAFELTQALEVDRCVVRLKQGSEHPVQVQYVVDGELPYENTHPSSARLAEWLTSARETVVVADMLTTNQRADRLDPSFRADLKEMGIRAVLFAPLMADGELIGGIGCHQARAPRQWSTHDIQFLEAVARQAAMALVYAQTHQAMVDRERELRLSEARLSSLLDIAPDAIISVDEAFRVILFNRAAEETFGFSADEMIGRTLDDLLPPRMIEQHRTYMAKLGGRLERAPHMLRNLAMVGLRRNGEEFPCEVSLSTLEVGNQVLYMAILRDVTWRKAVEQDLRESLKATSEREQQVSKLNDLLIAEHAQVVSLTAVASLIADGDLGVRATARASGELRELARAVNHMAEQLQARIREREESRRRIIDSQEGLRRRVAEQLHGSVQSKLVALWWRLGQVEELLERPNATNEIAAILRDVRAELERLNEEEIRGLSHQLHPASAEMGLGPALLTLRDQFDGPLAVAVEIDPVLLQSDDSLLDLPKGVVLTVYRVVEEALVNVAKHAHARSVTVKATAQPGRLVVTIADDGVGFVAQSVLPGLGLKMVQDYVDALGGILRISSVQGEGATVMVSLPIHTRPLT